MPKPKPFTRAELQDLKMRAVKLSVADCTVFERKAYFLLAQAADYLDAIYARQENRG